MTVHFSNAASATGTLLVGADGSRSTVRSHLFSREPCLARNLPLPVRFLGANVIYPPSLALKARTLDPFFFQAGDPQADTFLWFSFLNTPSKLDRHNGQGVWECQVNISYPYRTGFWGREEPLEVPATNEERVALLKGFAEGWAEPFRSLIMEIPDETQFKSLPIEDFVPREGMWDNAHGTVTMVGDAAHAMTICESFILLILLCCSLGRLRALSYLPHPNPCSRPGSLAFRCFPSSEYCSFLRSLHN